MGLTALDILVLLMVGGGAVLGFMRGFVCEMLSLCAWIAAIIALKLFHTPVEAALIGPVGTEAGASVLAFALVFGLVFIAVRMVARRMGAATRQSAVGPIDHFLGGGFGALKGLIGATLLYLAANLFYDTMFGRIALRPEWMTASRTYPLLHASGRAIVDFVEDQRGTTPDEEQN